MKKCITKVIVALAMCFSLAACSSQTTTETTSSANNGTFTGSSVGMQGTVTVEMSVEDGKIKERGTHETLMHQNAIYARLYEAQFKNKD